MKINKEGHVFRRSALYQCMKTAGPFVHEALRKRKGLTTVSLLIPDTYSILLRTPHRSRIWKNIHVYSYDWPIHNNPNPTQEDPVSMIIFTPEEAPEGFP